jgi:hypothetical protein
MRMSNRVICGDIKATTKQTLGTRTKAQVKYKNAKTDNSNKKTGVFLKCVLKLKHRVSTRDRKVSLKRITTL